MSSLIHDLRFSFRVIRKNPLTSAIIVATLALGIGANTAMFAGFDAWVLRPLDFDAPERLIALHETRPKLDQSTGVAPANLRDWQAASRSFEAIVPFSRTKFNFQGEDDPERVDGARVAAELFPFLGVDPIQGRHFLPDEDLPNGPAVAMISHSAWQRRFDSDPGVLGRTLRLDGVVHEVVGVMPPGFEFPEWAHVWTPIGIDPDAGQHDRWLSTVARLAPGASLEQARAEMQGIARRLEKLHPETNAGWSVEVSPLRENWSPPIIRLALTVSTGIALCVLLVICANVASLMLAQATGRRREMALRTALGASRRQLVRQTLTESVILALAGGGLGSVIGIWWVDWMKSWAPIQIPYLFRYEVDGRALVYTLAISLATGLVCALAPVLRSSDFDLATTLKSGDGRAGGSRGGRRLRSALVVVEFAVCVLLVVGAMLMVKSFVREQQIEPGYRTRGILTLRLSMTGSAYQEEAGRVAFLAQALERISGLGEVDSAGAANHLPVSRSGYEVEELEAEGRPERPGEEPTAAFHSVTESYLETLGIPIVEGRGFTAGEAREGGQVAILSGALARRLWPEGGALERRFRFRGDPDAPWLRVVGVAGDVDPGRSMVDDSRPKTHVYVPYSASPSALATLAVSSSLGAEPLAEAIRRELRRVDPGVPVSSVQTIAQAIDEVHWVSRMFTQSFSLYAAIALAVAALGIYGVTADSVSRRTREMGVRMSLGARPADLLRLVIRQTWILGAAGVALGLLGAYSLTGVMSSMLYQVSADDPVVFAGVALLLAGVALVAAYVPARRAARVDPMEVLRFE